MPNKLQPRRAWRRAPCASMAREERRKVPTIQEIAFPNGVPRTGGKGWMQDLNNLLAGFKPAGKIEGLALGFPAA